MCERDQEINLSVRQRDKKEINQGKERGSNWKKDRDKKLSERETEKWLRESQIEREEENKFGEREGDRKLSVKENQIKGERKQIARDGMRMEKIEREAEIYYKLIWIDIYKQRNG